MCVLSCGGDTTTKPAAQAKDTRFILVLRQERAEAAQRRALRRFGESSP